MSTVDRSKLAHGCLDVLIHGSFGDLENFADLPSRFAVCDPSQDFGFARRQFAFCYNSSAQWSYPVDAVRVS